MGRHPALSVPIRILALHLSPNSVVVVRGWDLPGHAAPQCAWRARSTCHHSRAPQPRLRACQPVRTVHPCAPVRNGETPAAACGQDADVSAAQFNVVATVTGYTSGVVDSTVPGDATSRRDAHP